MRIIVAITGASGIAYGVRLLEELRRAEAEVHLVVSEAAKKIMAYETDYELAEVRKLSRETYREDDIAAALASGSFQYDGAVIVPCSLKTLAALARGYADNLITRMGLCALKEGRRLVVVPRETPLDLASLRNLVAVRENGAVVLPAMPGFYHHPRGINELVEYVVGKILDQLGIPHQLFERWSGK
ncbi:MAG TPA: UbiX family flavin prenyltransferase [Thermoplasmatales archaeon]|nr:UbiX family flavin prenyltransferase [Candidatus Thermoplasmatota archaeon]HDS59520.1 UbiX family flavin prenyltransferase [Thermoplasmatales archaeon]